ncbi:sugar transport protein 7-like isoform X3 [Cicer arietinum]|uniref:Sugar transport protein 7-like isoform X3 n=1 Tax=Cicer arietinum TaxID=3827 RepID=A0A1S2YQL2_CICAR|nr:sugar transport protein 7-like isoform X3 [Cicer arietinum]
MEVVSKMRAEQYNGRVTVHVIIACIVAATGGSLFGYDVGISGGVTSMDEFLIKFFPSVYKQKMHAHENSYCKYNNQVLAAFTSVLYIAGLVASLIASPVTRKYGRKTSIIAGGISFLIGSILNAAAANLAMLIIGRIMLGVGIGFGDQILTGINSILFYAPVLFQSMGFGRDASLYSSALTGGVLAFSTFISIATVDRLGRRPLLISGGIQMIICQVIVAIILGMKFGENQEISKSYSIFVVVAVCVFVVAFGWSWGPLGWTVPSEIFPLEIRSAGQSITVAVNLLFTFIIAQSFLSLLCSFRFGIFLFFAGWIIIMTIFVYLFLPETKGIPIEEMTFMWRKHWFWKRIL